MWMLDVLLGECCVVSGCWQELAVNGLEVSQENTQRQNGTGVLYDDTDEF